jgi:hypothetical protein
MMDTPLLWHIPLSHFSEKVRWALDHKRIAHNRRVLGPDYLIRAWRATGRATNMYRLHRGHSAEVLRGSARDSMNGSYDAGE